MTMPPIDRICAWWERLFRKPEPQPDVDVYNIGPFCITDTYEDGKITAHVRKDCTR